MFFSETYGPICRSWALWPSSRKSGVRCRKPNRPGSGQRPIGWLQRCQLCHNGLHHGNRRRLTSGNTPQVAGLHTIVRASGLVLWRRPDGGLGPHRWSIRLQVTKQRHHRVNLGIILNANDRLRSCWVISVQSFELRVDLREKAGHHGVGLSVSPRPFWTCDVHFLLSDYTIAFLFLCSVNSTLV